MILIHLSEQEITAAAAGEDSARLGAHLDICPECQQHVELYRERLASLRQDVCLSATRSALEWGEQSRKIMHRITVSQMRAAEKSHGDWKWATVALAFALMIFAFVQWRRPEAPSTNTTASMSDAALLSDVAYTVDEDIPDALEPANLLVNQMGGIDETTTTSQPTSRRRTSR